MSYGTWYKLLVTLIYGLITMQADAAAANV